MNIKEIEQRSGMTRANVRFYEQEGLLSPRRLDNGYRDYSEDDLQQLHRIHLLRTLGLSLDEIRAAQKGELALGQLLENKALKKLMIKSPTQLYTVTSSGFPGFSSKG